MVFSGKRMEVIDIKLKD